MKKTAINLVSGFALASATLLNSSWCTADGSYNPPWHDHGDWDHGYYYSHDYNGYACDPDYDCYYPGLGISATFYALTLFTFGCDPYLKQAMLDQVSEDCAIYLDTGRETGILPSMLKVAREQLASSAGADGSKRVSDEQLVRDLLKAARDLL